MPAGAEASTTGLPMFEHFTFDHHLEGIVVGCRRDNKELFAIEVQDNAVREWVLRKGLVEDWLDPLPYEWRSTGGRKGAGDAACRRTPTRPAWSTSVRARGLGDEPNDRLTCARRALLPVRGTDVGNRSRHQGAT